MPKVTKVVPHLTPAEIQERIKQTLGFIKVQKWLVIYNAAVDPRPAAEIAKHIGLAKQTVHNLVCQYNRRGPEALESPGKGGRRRCYLSWEAEVAFLKPFEEKALGGQVATAMEIKRVLEQRLGHEVDRSMVYKMLKRHGWRKVMPRPAHVESKRETQEAFKKSLRRKSESSSGNSPCQ
jgi:transposase